MISNQVLQNTLEGLKEISRTEFCVLDTEGKVLASTFADFSIATQDVQAFVESQADSQLVKGFQYFKVCDDYQLEYILVAHVNKKQVVKKQVLDKAVFVKAFFIRYDQILDLKSGELANHISIFIVAMGNQYIFQLIVITDFKILEPLYKLAVGGKSKYFITAVDEKSIIVVKELEDGENYPEMDQLAHTILDTLGMGNDGKTHMAYGTIVNELKEVSRSYKEARMALDVGKIFFGDKEVIAYSSLGIGRLIYQLPIPLCKMFIKEIFGGKSPDDFDEETLVTIDKFFENSLNVSETSRQLYIHRNTLVYRLDKLQKSTGLDLRVFEDAITFKIALMVVRYMKYMETLEY